MKKEMQAEQIAREVHGLSGWQGVQNNGVEAISGLKNLANAWLRKNTGGGAIVTEFVYDDGTSRYYPSWK